MNPEEKNEISSVRSFHPPKGEVHSDSEPWKGYDEEDISLLFSIIFRAIFKDDIFSSNRKNKEILIDGENKEYRLQKDDKMIKMIRDTALKRIVNLESFKLAVAEIFNEKYPYIVSSRLDSEAITNNILKNFKSIGETHEMVSEAGEEKITDEEDDMIEYEANLKELYQHLTEVKKKIKSLEKSIFDLPHRVINTIEIKEDVARKISSETKEPKIEEEKMEGNGGSQIPKKELMEDFTSHGGRSQQVAKQTESTNGTENRMSVEDNATHLNENGGHNNGIENDEYEEIECDAAFNGDFQKSKLPKKATDLLQAWFLDNIANPYPTPEIKDMLSTATGLKKKQIQNWFTNSRKRSLRPVKQKLEGTKKSNTDPINTQQMNPPDSLQGMTGMLTQLNRVQPPNMSETAIKEHFTQMIRPEQLPIQQVYQPLTHPQNPTIIATQPIILQPPESLIPRNGFYYLNTPNIYPQPLHQPPPYQTNGIQATNGPILVSAGFIAQPQTNPIILNPPTPNPYLMINQPSANLVPVNMLMNGSYVVPLPNYSIINRNSLPNNQSFLERQSIHPQSLPTEYLPIDPQQGGNLMIKSNLNHRDLPQNHLYPEPISSIQSNSQIRGPLPLQTTLFATQPSIQINHPPENKSLKYLLKQNTEIDERKDHPDVDWYPSKKTETDPSGTVENPLPEKRIHKEDNEGPKNAFKRSNQE